MGAGRPLTAAAVRAVAVVEGESDAAAVRAAARVLGVDLAAHRVEIRVADGVTNFAAVLLEVRTAHPQARCGGLYDVADGWHVRRALRHAGLSTDETTPTESFGFFACDLDLEDALIRALGTERVEAVVAAQGELASFRRFQAMPQQRERSTHQQLRRFLGTRATRKIRSAERLVEALDAAEMPGPLAKLMSWLAGAPGGGDVCR